MARTVDPERYQARRLVIIDAALTCFATDGYERATTAAICRRAGIGSGTFFHYFPTKLGLLLAILDLGTAENGAWFADQEGRTDPAQVITDYVAHTASDLADPRMPGFVRAVSAIAGDPEVAAALARDEATTTSGLRPWIVAAQQAGSLRDDISALRLSEWILAVIDGYVGRLASTTSFDATAEQDMLTDLITRLCRP